MVGFAGIGFEVLTADGRFPMPVTDSDTLMDSYEADLLCTQSQASQLSSWQSRLTLKSAIGMKGGTVVVDSGLGPDVLTYPIGFSGEQSRTAILVDFSVVTHGSGAANWRAHARWVCL